jgi:serine/threonine protein kinase
LTLHTFSNVLYPISLFPFTTYKHCAYQIRSLSDIKPENILFNPIPLVPSKVSKKLQPSHPDDAPKLDEGEFQPGIGGGGIGTVKLADFGLSKVIWDASTMTPCGTVGYTAPEIVRDQKYSKAVDMWAMGCVLYTLLCGFPPFYDESIKTLTEKVARGEYSFLSPWWDGISDSAKDLITHLLCVNPDERYTIDEFLQHPWIKKWQENLPKETQPVPVQVEATPATNAEARKDLLSPGVSMKEVFDVTYAVQRMGEEKKRRKALYERIGNMKGADETNESTGILKDNQILVDSGDESSSTLGDSDADEEIDKLLPSEITAALTGNAAGDELTRRLQAAQQRKMARKLAEQKQHQVAAIANTNTQTTANSRRSRRAPFDLNMNNATLLMKRNVAPPKA